MTTRKSPAKAGTAKCPYCLRQRNTLSIYNTGIGKLCFQCLRGKVGQ